MSRVSNQGSRVGSAKSGMSEARRERLVDIQRREQLKGMLISKFKLKYGDKPNLKNFIDNEVGKFLKRKIRITDNGMTIEGNSSYVQELTFVYFLFHSSMVLDQAN